jgi:hypothetical protein
LDPPRHSSKWDRWSAGRDAGQNELAQLLWDEDIEIEGRRRILK